MKLVNISDRQRTITSHNQKISKEVVFGKGEVPHITQLAIAHIKASQEVEAHSHSDMYEVFFVESGSSGELNINGEVFQISRGCSFVVEPNEFHSITNNGTDDLVLQYFGVVK
jgi:quercetin dioxygenase-like cupin family protein